MADSAPTPPAREAIDLLAQVLAKLTVSVPSDAPQPEGLAGPSAAAFCGVSDSQWHDLNSRGLVPAPVLIGDGRCRRWLRSELLAWLRAGAPARARWELTKNQRRSA